MSTNMRVGFQTAIFLLGVLATGCQIDMDAGGDSHRRQSVESMSAGPGEEGSGQPVKLLDPIPGDPGEGVCEDCGACATDADCDGEQGQVCVLQCPHSHCGCEGGGLPDPESGACCPVRNTNGMCCYPEELDEAGNCLCVAEGVVDIGYGCECADKINARMNNDTGECVCSDPNAHIGSDGMCTCNTGYTPELGEDSGFLVCLPPPPEIIDVFPTVICEGGTITIYGNHFMNLLTDVLVGELSADVFVASPTQLTAVIPAGAVSGELVVITPSGAVTWHTPITICTPFDTYPECAACGLDAGPGEPDAGPGPGGPDAGVGEPDAGPGPGEPDAGSPPMDAGIIFDGGFDVPDGGFDVPDGGFGVPDGGVGVPDGGVGVPDGGVIIFDGGVVVRDGGVVMPRPAERRARGARAPGSMAVHQE
jgi:hypothetical protein